MTFLQEQRFPLTTLFSNFRCIFTLYYWSWPSPGDADGFIKGKLEYHFSSEKKRCCFLVQSWLHGSISHVSLSTRRSDLQETDQCRLEVPSSAGCGTAELLEIRGKSKTAACCMYTLRYFLLLLLGIAVGVLALCKAIKVNFAVLQQNNTNILYLLDQTPRLLFISSRNFVQLLFESGY